MPVARSGRARYRRIVRFAAWNLVVTWWFDLLLPRIGLGGFAARNRSERMVNFARKFRILAVELGGLMIKVGQYMSSRLDVLPPELTRELEGLQDEVPAVPFADIRQLAEAELGVPFGQVFAHVDEVPVAAASLGQVYRVTLSAADAAQPWTIAGLPVKYGIVRPAKLRASRTLMSTVSPSTTRSVHDLESLRPRPEER